MKLETQHWDPQGYDKHARFVSDLGVELIDLLNPKPGERILDLGCGDGALTARLLDRGCQVVGVDASPEMITAAKARGLDAHVCDGHELRFSQEFDGLLSNAALHWMKRPDVVATGVARALKPGGRFVGEFGGHGNVATIVGTLEQALGRRGISVECPWYFPRPEEYRTVLENAGFRVDEITSFPRPTSLPGDVGGWLTTFGQPYLNAVPESERAPVIAELVEALRPRLYDAARGWTADYVRLRFSARNAGVAS